MENPKHWSCRCWNSGEHRVNELGVMINTTDDCSPLHWKLMSRKKTCLRVRQTRASKYVVGSQAESLKASSKNTGGKCHGMQNKIGNKIEILGKGLGRGCQVSGHTNARDSSRGIVSLYTIIIRVFIVIEGVSLASLSAWVSQCCIAKGIATRWKGRPLATLAL